MGLVEPIFSITMDSQPTGAYNLINLTTFLNCLMSYFYENADTNGLRNIFILGLFVFIEIFCDFFNCVLNVRHGFVPFSTGNSFSFRDPKLASQSSNR